MKQIMSVLMSRGPARGTWAHMLGSMGTALILGLAYWWARSIG